MAKRGDRVRLLHTDDPHTRLEPGAEGTVLVVDDVGTVHVRWGGGEVLGMVADKDSFELIHDEPEGR